MTADTQSPRLKAALSCLERGWSPIAARADRRDEGDGAVDAAPRSTRTALTPTKTGRRLVCTCLASEMDGTCSPLVALWLVTGVAVARSRPDRP